MGLVAKDELQKVTRELKQANLEGYPIPEVENRDSELERRVLSQGRN